MIEMGVRINIIGFGRQDQDQDQGRTLMPEK
jgi:hypothetical protein